MPLVEENRVLVAHGLEVLNASPARPGLAALLAYGRAETVTARGIAFHIAPRLNAAGRMSDGSLAARLLLSPDMPEALDLAARLEAENLARRAKGEEMLGEARALIESERLAEAEGIVVHSESFHEGIIGITAARLVECYHRPVIVLARNGEGYKGSARSVPGVNVTAALAACAELLSEYGGHAGAAGCSLPGENLEAFRERFLAACARLKEAAKAPALELEGRLEPGMLSEELVQQVLDLEPFGHGNAKPAFLIEQRALPEPQPFGNGHLRWTLGPRAEMVAWGAAERLRAAPPGACYRVRMGFHDFRGARKIRLVVEDFRNGM
jgi:single-stranded-DNA-specific exonuclease